MKIMFNAKEVALLKKVGYKFGIENETNETLINNINHGYLEIEENHEGFTATISEVPVLMVLETLNRLAPKIMQAVGAAKAIVSLAKDLFNDKFNDEIAELTNAVYYKTYQGLNNEAGTELITVDENGKLSLFRNDLVCSSDITYILAKVTKEYDSKPHLKDTVVGRNLANTIYELSKHLDASECKGC